MRMGEEERRRKRKEKKEGSTGVERNRETDMEEETKENGNERIRGEDEEKKEQKQEQEQGESICIPLVGSEEEGEDATNHDTGEGEESIGKKRKTHGVWKRIIRRGEGDGHAAADISDGPPGGKYLISYVGYIVIEETDIGNASEQRDEKVVHIDGKVCSATHFADYIREQEIIEIIADGHRSEDEDNDSNYYLTNRSKICRGLVAAVSTMRPFERAMITVTSRYGYGEEGNFSFPHIPPRSTLLYDVVVMNIEPLALGGLRSDMFFEGRVRAAHFHKDAGNKYFKRHKTAINTSTSNCTSTTSSSSADDSHTNRSSSNQNSDTMNREFDNRDDACFDDISRARFCYLCGLSYFSDDVMMQVQDASVHSSKYIDMAHEVKIPLHLNIAAVNLKSGLYREALAHCSTVLRSEKNNEKALLRRARAYIKLNQLDAAEADAMRLSHLAGDKQDADVESLLNQIKNEQIRERRAQKTTFGGMFSTNHEKEHEEKDRDNGETVQDDGKSWLHSLMNLRFW